MNGNTATKLRIIALEINVDSNNIHTCASKIEEITTDSNMKYLQATSLLNDNKADLLELAFNAHKLGLIVLAERLEDIAGDIGQNLARLAD